MVKKLIQSYLSRFEFPLEKEEKEWLVNLDHGNNF